MEEPPTVLEVLPDGFDQLPVDEAIRTLLRAVVDDRETYFELRVRHSELVRWIEAEE